MEKINFESISFKMIAHSGESKGFMLDALKEAKQGNFDQANVLVKKAIKSHGLAGHAHMDIVAAEAAGEKINIPVLFMHAEDQMMNCETLIIVISELIDMIKNRK